MFGEGDSEPGEVEEISNVCWLVGVAGRRPVPIGFELGLAIASAAADSSIVSPSQCENTESTLRKNKQLLY